MIYLCHGTDLEFDTPIPEMGLAIKDAMRIVYSSNLYEKLQDPETGLYREGPAYLYDMLAEERGITR